MNKIMCLIPLLFASLTTVSLSIDDNTSFLAKISLFPFRSDYSIYCVLKIGTTQLYTGRVISQTFCKMFFVLLHFVVNKPFKVLLRGTEGISYQYGRHSMTDCS